MNCPQCGNPVATGATACDHCGMSLTRQPVQTQVTVEKRENILTGTVGAVIGAVIGAAAIIALSQMGYVAAISGLILAVCTLKGYELLGGRLGVVGTIICVVLMLVTPYIADRIDWAIVIVQAYAEESVTFAQAYAAVPMLIEEEAIEMGDYLANLGMLYAFALLGGVGTVIGKIKKK